MTQSYLAERELAAHSPLEPHALTLDGFLLDIVMGFDLEETVGGLGISRVGTSIGSDVAGSSLERIVLTKVIVC